MSGRPTPELDPVVLGNARELCEQGQPLEAVLTYLRDCGWNIFESVRAVRILRTCSLRDAKDLVFTSMAWMDVRTAHDQRLLEVFRARADADPQVTLRESSDQFRVHIDLCDGPTPPN